jgi:hypothetical protein
MTSLYARKCLILQPNSKLLNEKGKLKLTAPEYIQLKAFARVDGVMLSVLWLVSFCCYILGITTPLYGLLAFGLAIATPFYVGSRLKRFRDDGLDGAISLLRGWAYVVLVFFYGGLLFAIGQFIYFSYVDHGYLLLSITQMLSVPETAQALRQMGMTDQINETLQMMGEMRPIDITLSILTNNILIGIAIGLPIAALMQRKGEKVKM